MKVFSFEKDECFYIGDKRHVIVRKVADAEFPDDYLKITICYEDMAGLYGQNSVQELLARYARGELRLGEGKGCMASEQAGGRIIGERKAALVSDADKDSALWKVGYIQAVLNHGPWKESEEYLAPIIASHALLTGDRNKPGTSTVRKWHRRWKANNREWQSLLPRHDRKGNREPRFTEEESQLFLRVIHSEYMTEQRRSVKHVYEKLVIEIRRHNIAEPGSPLRYPSEATVYRMINEIPAYERKRSRYGRHAANLEFRQGKVAPQPTRILEVAEIDHTPIDLEIVCRKTGLTLGTPWLTLIIDGYSRMVLGYYITFDPPSVQSVVKALEHAINPKLYLRERYPSVKNEWPTFGRMSTLVCDNGPEFHAHELERIALMMGFIMQFCPSRVPYYKGKIERFFGTISKDLFHSLPGTTFSNYVDKGEYESEKKAAITLETLNAVVHKWIVDIYHQKIHRTINETPISRWKKSTIEFPPSLPHTAALIGQSVLRVSERKLRVGGIEVNKISYNSDALWELRKRIGNDMVVEVRFDHEDLSKIYVKDPESGELLEANSTVPSYTNGLILAEHKAIQSHLRKNDKSSENIFELISAREDIQRQFAEDVRSQSKAKRRETVRKAGINSTRLQAPTVTTAKKYDADDIWTSTGSLEKYHALPNFDIV